MEKKLIEIVLDNGILFGILFIVFSLFFFISNLNEKKSFKEHNISSWKVYVSGWALFVLLLLLGLGLLMNKF